MSQIRFLVNDPSLAQLEIVGVPAKFVDGVCDIDSTETDRLSRMRYLGPPHGVFELGAATVTDQLTEQLLQALSLINGVVIRGNWNFTEPPTINGEPISGGFPVPTGDPAVGQLLGVTGVDPLAFGVFDVEDATAADLGLDNVDNTADVSKPVSTPQANAIATVRALVDPGFCLAFPPGSALGGQVWSTANNARYCRVVSGGTISKIGMHVTVASGNISAAAYTGSGSGFALVPTTQLATSGTVACPAVGYAEVSLGATITVKPGDFLALSCDNATAAFAGASGQDTSALFAGQSYRASTAHPLPATAAGLTASSFRLPALIGVP